MPTTSMFSNHQRRNLLFAGVASAVVLAGGLFLTPDRIADRVWSNLLVGTFALLTIGLGGTVFVALTYVSGAGWNVAFRRVPEAMSMLVPITGVAILVVLAVRMQEYGWHPHGDGDAGTFWFKEFWLTPSFWLLRAAAYVIIWSLLGGWLVSRSKKQDTELPAGGYLAGNVRLSAAFLAVYAVTFSLASADWLMALEPLWFSTMWGVYNFAGMIFAALAVVVILCILLSGPTGPLGGVFNTEHLHDLGRLLVGFSCFWMYIWFSQYMLIWYSNLPEETSYFITRTHGPWGPVVVLSIILNWFVPFFVLLPKPAKRSPAVMFKVAVVILIGRWVDLGLMVYPYSMGETPRIGIWEMAAVCCAATIGVLLLDRCFRAVGNPVPENDRYLAESLHYHAH